MKMKTELSTTLKYGSKCKVIGGTHTGKSGTVKDIKIVKQAISPLLWCSQAAKDSKHLLIT